MAELSPDRDCKGVASPAAEAGSDATRDIIRQMIVEAEAMPARVPKPVPAATPRPPSDRLPQETQARPRARGDAGSHRTAGELARHGAGDAEAGGDEPAASGTASGAAPGGDAALAPDAGAPPEDFAPPPRRYAILDPETGAPIDEGAPDDPFAQAASGAVPGAALDATPDAAPDAAPEDDPPAPAPRGYAILDPDTGAPIPQGPLDASPEAAVAPPPPPPPPRRAAGPGPVARGLLALGRLCGQGAGAVWREALRPAIGAFAAGLGWIGRAVVRFLRRPDAPRWLSLVCLAVFVLAWPRDVLWVSLIFPLAALITWASVGNDGIVELIARWHGRLKARDPNKAERIRLRAKATSAGIARMLAVLPARWTKGIRLPDFEPEGYVPEHLCVAPFEDFAAQVRSSKRREL